MVELDMLRAIADDLSKSEWCMGLSAALHKTLEDIERETYDISGYESDVLAWVEKNGGLDAVKERTMPEDMSWPFYEDGEPVRIGEYVICDERCSSAAVDCIEFNESGFKLYGESGHLIAGSDMPYSERVKRPAPPVLDADGAEVHRTDRVWLLDGSGPYTVDCNWGDGTCSIVELVEHVRADQLTHRAPVLAADGKPLREGEHVYHVETGAELVVKELPKPGEYQAVVVFAPPASHLTSFDPDQLTHERPDSFSLIEQDSELTPYNYALKYGKPDGVSNGKFQRVDLVRRCKALAEKED